jgi:hypothetical protein
MASNSCQNLGCAPCKFINSFESREPDGSLNGAKFHVPADGIASSNYLRHQECLAKLAECQNSMPVLWRVGLRSFDAISLILRFEIA